MIKSEFEAAVGMSRKWDAREAGREVARRAIKNLNSPPSFFLLFSTIHYKDYGGFQEFLDGVWDILPNKTPLVGGTVAGFINSYGCFTRGATGLAVSYPRMDIAMGYGVHTKRNPKKAAKACAKMIKEGLKESSYKNKFLINVISGPIIGKFPFIGRVNSVKSRLIGLLLAHLGMPITEFFGFGIGKEDEIVDALGDYLGEYHIIGGSSMDNGNQLVCYQFLGKDVYKNSIVAIGGANDLPIFLRGTIDGLHETDKRFKITKMTFGRRIITKIDKKPAKKQYTELMNLPVELYKDLSPFYYKTSNYYPITFEGKREYITGVGAFLGDNILLGYKSRGNDAIILSVSGKDSINAIDKVFDEYAMDYFPFMFMSASSIRFMNMIGDRTYDVKAKLDYLLPNIPYLLVGYINENIGYPNRPVVSRVYSFNVMSFDKNKRNDLI